MSYDFDLFVIGGGSGGVRAARVAAGHGARVAIAEEYRYGGTCVIRGCVPKKLFVYAAEFQQELDHARHYGWSIGDVSFDWRTLVAAKDREIARLEGFYSGAMDRHDVKRFDARASLLDAHTIAVGDDVVTAEYILVATGARPYISEFPGREHVITSDQAFHLESLPEHITIVGGGYIAVEFASIFRGLGRRVTIIHRGEHLLRGFDQDIRVALGAALEARGIELRLSTQVEAISREGDGYRVLLDDKTRMKTPLVMYAIGRLPNTSSMGLEQAGVELGERGRIVVDESFRSSVPSVFAVGDVIDRVALTPVAIREAQAFADGVFGSEQAAVPYDNIPTAVFSLPPIGTIGLSEEAARERYGDVDIYKSQFRPLKLTLTEDPGRMLMKLVVAPSEGGRIVGIHLLGADSPEIIQTAAIAVTMGATKKDFSAAIALHPSTAEELVLMRKKA